MSDEAGNSTVSTLGVTPKIDRNAPDVHSSVDLNLIKHLRLPWGSASQAAGNFFVDVTLGDDEDPATSVIPSTAFPNPELEQFRIYRSFDAAGAIAVGRRVDGGWTALTLDAGDLARLWLSVVDAAGNESSKTSVLHGEWVASFAGKVANDAFENPHVFEERAWTLSARQQDGSIERGSNSGIADVGDVPVQTRGAATWRRYDGVRPHRRSGPAFAFDYMSGDVFMFSGYYPGGCDEAGFTNECKDAWLWNGVTWSQRDVEDIEGDGSPTGGQMLGAVHDIARDEMLLIGGDYTAQMWAWNRERNSFRKITPLDPENDGNPPDTWPYDLSYDSRRQEVLFLTPNSSSGLLDTWIWNGSSWRLASPSNAPGARTAFGIDYDSSADRTVIFGGSGNCHDGSGTCRDTWSWDGTDWTRIGPPSAETSDNTPDGRGEMAFVYDARRDAFVMFGGYCATDPDCNQTWELNGDLWSQVSVGDAENDGNPTARTRTTGVYDPARGLVLLYSGQPWSGFCDVAGDSYCGTLWGFDGSSWHHLSADGRVEDTVPGPRTSHGMAWNDTAGQLVVVGGGEYDDDNCDGSGQSFCTSSWIWDGGGWTELPNAPMGPRTQGLAVPVWFDDGTISGERTLFYGGSTWTCSPGCSNSFLSDTWLWDGATWVDYTSTAGTPSRQVFYGAAHDLTVPHMYAVAEPVHSWSGDAWSTVTETCTTCPNFFSQFSAAYDQARGVIVVADNLSNSYQFETWEGIPNGTTIEWTRILDGSEEGALSRKQLTLGYHQALERVVMFAGQIGGTLYTSDTHVWDGAAWVPLEIVALEGTPAPRAQHQVAYAPSRDELLVFGGRQGIAAESTSNELWGLDGGADAYPGHVARFQFGAARVDPAIAKVDGIDVRWLAAGAGDNGTALADGAELWVMEQGRWRPTGVANTAAATSPSGLGTTWELSWTEENPASLDALLFGGDQEFAVLARPAYLNGVRRGLIATDYVEARVRYSY